MNLLLLRTDDHIQNNTVTINDYRAAHIINVLKLTAGCKMTIGLINNLIGKAEIAAIDGSTVFLSNIQLNDLPPAQLDVELILALPRPRMLQRSLQTIATMGVKKLHLLHTERVEKSFWQTPLLKPEAIAEQFILGLEQAKATQAPEVVMHSQWRRFVQEQLPKMTELNKIIAHPGHFPKAYAVATAPTALAIGPEGGFTASEVEVFIAHNFKPVQLGERILRVETAVPVLLAKLF